MRNKPCPELLWMQTFAKNKKFEKFKCEMITMTGSHSPTLTIAIPSPVTEEVRLAFYDHLKDVQQRYTLFIRELGYFECWFRDRQLNVVHNNRTSTTWDSDEWGEDEKDK
jgi:hypothetical protein